jgi:hypothetical protein
LRRFGVDGITFANMHTLYDPKVSGFGSMESVRNFLIKNGMTPHFADILGARYVKHMEENSLVVSIIDLFNSERVGSEAISAMTEASFKDVMLNYKTIN